MNNSLIIGLKFTELLSVEYPTFLLNLLVSLASLSFDALLPAFGPEWLGFYCFRHMLMVRKCGI